ncbi:MAG TPA: lmo0937 family membrane protein [Methylomirabilota bacterium]|nr:lmo0937 family membrane protein [Methylomirabilota bacterium]
MFKSNFLIAFVVLVVLWALDLFVLHLTGGLIHVLLVAGVVMLIVHFLRGRP